MTENKRFQIIHLGNPYDFVVKDHNTNKTYGTLQGDDKSLMRLLNELNDENQELHIQNDFLKDENRHMRTVINENMQLKKLLRKISNCNGEIWLSNGRIIRLKRIFNGEWIND